MSAKRHERTRARSSAVQVLYTSEIQGKPASKLLAEGAVPPEVGELSAYAVKLVEGVEAYRSVIDGYLASTSENWAVSRMPVLDRSILRLATYEMVYVKDVPVSVAINEAVELAKDFGGKDESPNFVNGVLGRIARGIEAGDVVPVEPAEVAEPVEGDSSIEEVVDVVEVVDAVEVGEEAVAAASVGEVPFEAEPAAGELEPAAQGDVSDESAEKAL